MTSAGTDRYNGGTHKGSFRQAMSWLHTWAGLTLGVVLYFIFITGSVGYFDTEVDRWMQPELPLAQTDLSAAGSAALLLTRLEAEAPAAKRWGLILPADRHTPYARIFWRGASIEAGATAASGNLQLDATTGKPFSARASGGGQVLYRMHWLLHYLPRTPAEIIVGFASLFMLVALITGVIAHKKIFKDFFTFRPAKGQRSWLDAHNVLSVVALPFYLMITYSGLVFMGFVYMPLVTMAYYGVGDEARQQLITEVFDPPGLVDAAGESAPPAALNDLIARAEARWGAGQIRFIDIRHPGDRNARIIFNKKIGHNVIGSNERLVFDGVSGELLHTVPPTTSVAKGTRDLFLSLHEGLFAPVVLRWLYFMSGLLGAAMIATGLVLWAVKRRQRLEKKHATAHFGLRLVEKLNVGTVVGLPIGIAAYFWANRVLPLEITDRADWEVHIMFLTWLIMLVHALLRPAGRAWAEQFAVAALAFGLLPVLNFITTDRHLGQSLAAGDWVFAGFDLTVLAIGLLSGWAAWRVSRRLQPAYTKTPAGGHAAIKSERALYGSSD